MFVDSPQDYVGPKKSKMASGWIKKKCPEPSTRNQVQRRPSKPRLVYPRALGHNRGSSEEKVNDGHDPEDRTAKDAALLYREVRLHVSTLNVLHWRHRATSAAWSAARDWPDSAGIHRPGARRGGGDRLSSSCRTHSGLPTHFA
jgi:hypothetical protein